MNDTLQRFIFDKHPVRGEHIDLSQTFQAAVQHVDYPAPLQHLLGEALAAAALLVAMLKIEGRISLQIQGDGQGSLLIAEANHQNELRGMINFDEGIITAPIHLKKFFNSNALIITIEPDQGERYQGLVPLEGETLSDAIEFYFAQSEQLPTKLYLAANDMHATGLMLQVLPDALNNQVHWEHLIALTDTLNTNELLSTDVETLLYRLFHEEQVRLLEAETVSFNCRCSREKVASALKQISPDELRELIKTQDFVESTCGFCHANYRFDAIDIEALIADSSQNQTLQ